MSTTSECSCTRSRTSSRPSGETSKSRTLKSGGRLVNWRSAPVSEIDEPEVLVLDLSAHHHQRASSVKEAQASGSARQREIRNRVGGAVGGHRLHRERGSDVRARVDEEVSGRRPHGIDGVFPNQRNAAPSSEMRKRCGVPSTFAADVIDCPSGAHAGAPRNSSDSVTTRALVPSAFITYSSVLPRCSTENATRCPSGAISGPPMIRASGALHSSVAAPSASFQIPSLVPFDETYSR